MATRKPSKALQNLLRAAGGANTAEDAISVIAHEMLRHTTFPPTDLYELCRYLDIEIREVRSPPVAGQFTYEYGSKVITHAADLQESRLRFTIAHEIGHDVIGISSSVGGAAARELERLCDRFAVELLMPRMTFLSRLRAPNGSPNVVLATASFFRTSLQMTALRFCEFLTNYAVFFFVDGRIRWWAGALDGRDPTVGLALTDAIARQSSLVFGRSREWHGLWHIETLTIGADCLTVLVPAPRSAADMAGSAKPVPTPRPNDR